VHLTLDLNWGVGRYSRYQCRSYMRKSAQVSDLHKLNSSRWLLLISALFKHDYQSRVRAAGYWANIKPFAVDGSHIKWVWLRSLAVHDRSFVLKHGKRRTWLSSVAVWQVIYRSYLDYLKFRPHKPAIWAAFFEGSYTWAHIRVNIRP
jgi:hypothetical protein